MRISYWSSDVCSSDLGVQDSLVLDLGGDQVLALGVIEVRDTLDCQVVGLGGTGSPNAFTRVGIDQVGDLAAGVLDRLFGLPELGRASCRESVCQYVSLSVVAVSLKKHRNITKT